MIVQITDLGTDCVGNVLYFLCYNADCYALRDMTNLRSSCKLMKVYVDSSLEEFKEKFKYYQKHLRLRRNATTTQLLRYRLSEMRVDYPKKRYTCSRCMFKFAEICAPHKCIRRRTLLSIVTGPAISSIICFSLLYGMRNQRLVLLGRK